ncbi:hypothetical protein MBM_01570 [Drepanopeziza brunnea f. sp. 'multigermtubi' MB_m1]|uniref:Uncharacterized protein n=1 Tax=Marssonina brunnea f. sp. multigermtubi (strain MB_m1) TaxID=1072389 RepID=K1XFP5_MARBU|nr:uncharacterized protein MBM_01570 [Drepanopeziza brunnea f. sp. 'multigermtubi' MB_m1]EKD19618.1 hypothetical protein MBM_01570 [Drepanopeziza brunnea f. sp. 'multigermtubi' MB_m1]
MDRSNLVTAPELVQIAFEFLNDPAKKAKAPPSNNWLLANTRLQGSTMLHKPGIILNSRRALIMELVPNPARLKEQRLGASADRSNRFNKFSSLGNAPRLAIKTLRSSRKDPNTPKLFRHYSVNEIEYGARPEYGLYSDDSDDGPYSDALKDHQELPLADLDALDNKGNVEA